MNERILFGVGAAAILTVAAALGAGCGVDNSEDEPATGGTSGTGGGETGGGATTGGSTNGGAPNATGGAGGGGSDVCAHTAPPSTRITDFTELEGETWTGGDDNREWGDSVSLTGGTFHYGTPLTASVTDGVLNLSGTITEAGYSGFGFWFGPCTDVSSYSGITFNISGDLGETELQVQLQTSGNYPIAADKGECPFTSEETKWEECVNNSTTVTVPAGGGVIQIPWADFVGGTPDATLDPSELLGVQWQFNCGGECVVSANLDDVAFY